MSFDLPTVLVVVTAFLSGVVAALKLIAPRTKNTKDDKVLEYAEKGLELLPEVPPVDKK